MWVCLTFQWFTWLWFTCSVWKNGNSIFFHKLRKPLIGTFRNTWYQHDPSKARGQEIVPVSHISLKVHASFHVCYPPILNGSIWARFVASNVSVSQWYWQFSWFFFLPNLYLLVMSAWLFESVPWHSFFLCWFTFHVSTWRWRWRMQWTFAKGERKQVHVFFECT